MLNPITLLFRRHFTAALIGFISIITLAANAQTAAPQLRCVSKRFNGDIDLTWQVPATLGCGTLAGFRIFASQTNRSGPYSLLAAINSPTDRTYTHTSANGNNSTWFYYMEIEAGCLGQSLSSDTLDNQPPLPPEFKFVTIENNQIAMEWERGTDPETNAYILYDADSNQALDTVFGRNNTRFVDIRPNPNNLVRSYTLVALDSCFNAGIVNVRPHHTILLQAATNRCTQSIDLTWNKYDNWRNNVEQYEIWVGKNGAPSAPVDTVANTTLTYSYKDFTDGDLICFELHGIENATQYTSASNAVCRTASVVQPTAFIYLKNASVTPNDEVALTWAWNTNIDMESYGINSSSNNASYQRFSVLSPIFPLQNANQIDAALQPINKQKTYYKIETIDSCQQSFFSNYVATIFLEAQPAANYQNQLTWSAYEHPFGTLLHYEVYRIDPTTQQERKISTQTTRSFLDNTQPNIAAEQDVCYYVLAVVRLNLPNGGLSESVKSRSNRACAHQEVQIFVPNAFAPDGNNAEFKPLAAFNETAEYYMAIYDRWGGILFETSDINSGWRGTKNGNPLPQGTYTYYIKANEPNGKPIIRRGSVLLVR